MPRKVYMVTATFIQPVLAESEGDAIKVAKANSFDFLDCGEYAALEVRSVPSWCRGALVFHDGRHDITIEDALQESLAAVKEGE